jgi:UTP:GlnB (protein PII) uridylyltransferase
MSRTRHRRIRPQRPRRDRRLRGKVGTQRRLIALYLLTVADIRGTSPKVWNAWKGKLLEDLYRYTLRALGGGAPNPTPRSRPASARRWS